MTGNPLTDLIPATARKYVYGVLVLVALAFTVWQAAGGNWTEFVGGLVVALVNAMAASNTGATITPASEGGIAPIERGEAGESTIALAFLIAGFLIVLLWWLGVRP